MSTSERPRRTSPGSSESPAPVPAPGPAGPAGAPGDGLAGLLDEYESLAAGEDEANKGVPEAARDFAAWLGGQPASVDALALWLVQVGYRQYPMEDLELIREVVTGARS